VSAHQGTELLADTVEGTETVVLGKGLEEVLDETGLVATGDLGELLNDGLLVGVAQGGGTEDVEELLVGLQSLTEAGDGAGGLVEVGRLGGGSVLIKGRLEKGSKLETLFDGISRLKVVMGDQRGRIFGRGRV
jgi:hypothetical protein